ncbi:helix-turn-helix transcriptional regulator [Clostridium oryzae]|uniref:HTH-type transcriptional regulator MalT n=1 Tax=Clostridium oryzae TaxID=1450648 RepID=A0A1V4IZI2_9CLOT|nr:LuxR C-terminal-related transcriptional regulator [Clostridium oryzae]OPJ65240.1 HTH-type transcriptional regulator MalT [Clostridium oryzae]
MRKSKILRRKRVNGILSSIYDYSLTIVEAPIGFGKTTAVMDFIHSESSPCLFIAFYRNCDTYEEFWCQFLKEINKLDKSIGIKLEKLGFPTNVSQLEKTLLALDDIDFDRKTILVIDDYHLCENRNVNDFIMRIAAEQLDNLHIVIVTRSTINIDFVEMLSKGICNVISQQQLKFNNDEIHDYCKMVNSDILENDIEKIKKYTDGWISFMYIVLRGLDQGIPVGIDKSIDELIESTLFQVYDEEIQTFLLKLSILDTFSEKLALYITENLKTHEILKKLLRENAFVFYDEINKTYKIHNVLLDFLRMRQNFKSSEIQRLNRRLGNWYMDRRELLTAYSYYYKSEDYNIILTHLNNPNNIDNNLIDFDGVVSIFENLSEEELCKYPIAYLQYIFMRILRGSNEIVLNCIEKLEKFQYAYEHMESIDLKYKKHIIAEILIIKKFTCFNHLDKISETSEQALKLLNGEQSYIMKRENEFTFGSPQLIYIYFREQGTFNKILQLAKLKFPNHAKLSNGCGTGAEYLAQAEYSLETGDWEMAELYSTKAIYKASTKSQYSIIICARFNLMRLYVLQNKIDQALAMLKQLGEKVMLLNNFLINTTFELCKGYLYANLCQPEKAPYWLQTGNVDAADLFYQGVAFNYIVYGKTIMAAKNYIKLEIESESFVEYFSIYNNQLGFIHNAIFDSVAKFNLYGMEIGKPVLERILKQGQADDIIMPFVEDYMYIEKMIIDVVAQENPNNKYIKRIIKYGRQYVKSISSINSHRAKLSPREIEVLSLVAEGLNRGEIASRLVLSQSTVKKHLQNIYSKLDANGKIEAIRIARKYDLLK